MQFLKIRKQVPLVLSFMLLFVMSFPGGIGSVHASQTGMVGANVKMAAGVNHTLVLKPDGTVAAWGDHTYDQTNVPPGLSAGISIAAGAYHSLVLQADGTVVAWGRNNDGQTSVPAGLNGVKAIAAGAYHSLALQADGTVVAWGRNDFGQSDVPVGLNKVKAIAAGDDFSLALQADGTVVAWGGNDLGQLDVPVGLDGVKAIAAGGAYSLALRADGTVVAWGSNDNGQTDVPGGLDEVISIAAGAYHSLALQADGTVVAWGGNDYGQTDVPGGLDGVTAIAAGVYHSLALQADGTVVAWGRNDFGQTNVPAEAAMPVKVSSVATGYAHSLALKTDGTVAAWGYNYYGQTNVPAGLNGVKAISAGTGHSLALKADGTVVAWGRNDNGQANVPAGLNGVVAIAAGISHSIALKADGTFVAWGYTSSGQGSVPPGLGAVVELAGGYNHTLALKPDGTVAVWGSNYYNQLAVPAGLDGVVAITSGIYHSLVLKSDGTVAAWGFNVQGQSNVPAGLDNVKAIAAGEYHSLAVKADGKVVAWGVNQFGIINVPAGLDQAVMSAGGTYHSVALRANGSVVPWENNAYGQMNMPGDSRLIGLTLQEGVLKPSFSPSVTEYTYYYGSSISSVQITATLADPAYAALYVNNQPYASGTIAAVSVSGASTAIPIRVEPYLKPALTYTITVQQDVTPPDVQYNANGNAAPARTAESTVTATDEESGIDSLQYAWTQSAVSPASGWTSFASGDTLRQNTGEGGWYLHVRASDLAGNVTETVSNVFELDNTAPVITLNGSNPMYVPQGGSYAEPGASALDAVEGAIPPSDIAISGIVNTAVLGNYTIRYSVADSAGNDATVTRDVYVYDGDAPMIHLRGSNPMTTEAGEPFVDPGATAQDPQDGDLTGSIVVTGAVDPSTLGTYTLSYDVSDTVGNKAPTVTRTVYVKDTQPPVLSLLGDPRLSVSLGASFTDPGAQALDAYYGDVSRLIVVTGTVDTGKAGVYTLRYNATDPSGNRAAEATRTVTVLPAEDPGGSDDADDPGGSNDADGSDGMFQVSIKINGEVQWVNAAHETFHGQRVIRIFPTAEQVSAAFDAEPDGIRVEAEDIGDAVIMDLPAAPLLHAMELRQDARLEWSVNGNGLRIPLRMLQGVSEEGTVAFTIAAAAGFAGGDGNGSIAKAGGEPLLPCPVVYTVQEKHGDRIDWAPAYAVLTAVLQGPADPYHATAVRIDEHGHIRFAPSVFSTDGSLLVTIRSPYDGAYAVMRSDHAFADVNGHWAQEDIVLTANKLLVEGRGKGLFVPDDSVTRAEFAAMLVRALGLDDESNDAAPFRDVAPVAWHAGAVKAAHEAGLIDGFEDGTFRPEAAITREQMAVMIARAMEFAGSAPVAGGSAAKPFADEADIAPWARGAVDRLTGAAVINGLTETTFGPREHATRAQSAALLKRMLQAMQWINP